MAEIGENQLKLQIKDKQFSNVYMIYGEENYLKEFYVNKLKKIFLTGGMEDFNFHSYEGKNTTLFDIINDAQMLPMMGEYVVCLIHDYPFDKSNASKSDMKLLKEFLKDIPESAAVIFWYDTINIDSKESGAYKTLSTAISKNGTVVNLQKRTEYDLVKMLVAGAKKRNCVLSSENAKYLIRVSGADIKTLLNELEKITGFINSGEIKREDIDKLATKTLQSVVFDITKAMQKQDFDSAYSILNNLLNQKEDPIAILAVITMFYVDMYRAKCANIANVNESNIVSDFAYGRRAFTVKNATRDCRKYSVKQLRKSLDILSSTDEKLKSTGIDQRLLLEETLLKLMFVSKEV